MYSPKSHVHLSNLPVCSARKVVNHGKECKQQSHNERLIEVVKADGMRRNDDVEEHDSRVAGMRQHVGSVDKRVFYVCKVYGIRIKTTANIKKIK